LVPDAIRNPLLSRRDLDPPIDIEELDLIDEGLVEFPNGLDQSLDFQGLIDHDGEVSINGRKFRQRSEPSPLLRPFHHAFEVDLKEKNTSMDFIMA
jgi:hypothetical protein